MINRPNRISRRAFLATAVATAVVTTSFDAFGQTQDDMAATDMKIQVTFDGQTFTATLYDNPSAMDFASMLPLNLSIEDYSTNEKIVYLPRKLTEEGRGRFDNPRPGDLCYYIPWGNVIFYHAGYSYGDSLIRLGRLDGGVEPLLTKGEFPVSIELVQ